MSINSDSQEDIQGIIIANSEDSNLLSSVRRRVEISKNKVETGSLNVLSAKYEVNICLVIPNLNIIV